MNRYGRKSNPDGGKIERVEPIVVHLSAESVDTGGPGRSWCGRYVAQLDHVQSDTDPSPLPPGVRLCTMCKEACGRHQRGFNEKRVGVPRRRTA